MTAHRTQILPTQGIVGKALPPADLAAALEGHDMFMYPPLPPRPQAISCIHQA